ncbi:MAG: hypothetical protein IPP03_13490 [Dechloromonas sp.]|nr:hypothetical protein [Candidatus Dechloromonas phosphoritropha]MBP8788721.1 hypothetical protein [Azonexus sp.]
MVAVILGFPVGTVSAGILTLSDTAFAQITAGGSAVWARLFDAADTWIADYTVGTQAMHDSDPATAEVILAATTLYTGAFLALIGAQIVAN